MNQHELGTSPRLVVDFVDSVGDPYDPTAIELKVKDPAGAITTKAKGDLTQEAAGTWFYVWPVVTKGIHTFRYVGNGPTYDISAVGYFKATDAIGS
jgi:hypothetical protein